MDIKQFCPKLPPEANTAAGALAVCASGHSIWSDLEQVPGFVDRWEQSFDIMAVNDAGMHIPYNIQHWYSNDVAMLPFWHKARRPRFGENETKGEGIVLHSCNPFIGINWQWPGGGTSTLNAVMTGLGLGYDRIYICGAPLDDGGHYFDPPWVKTNFSRSGGLREWESRKPYFEGKVASMSGNTKKILDE